MKFAIKLSLNTENPLKSKIFCTDNINSFSNKPALPKPFYCSIKMYQDVLNLNFPRLFKFKNLKIPPWLINLLSIDYSLNEQLKSRTNMTIYHQLFNSLKEKYKDFIDIYTDGSVSDHGCGCAIVIEEE